MSVRVIALLLGVWVSAAASRAHARPLALIPQPRSVEVGEGSFALDPRMRIVAPGGRRAAEIAGFLRAALGMRPVPSPPSGRSGRSARGASVIELRIDPSVRGEEAYRLAVAPRRIVVAAADERGLFWGVQTLIQLVPNVRRGRAAIPAVRIEDAPAYRWRGVMLDVARHFQPVAFVERQIDLMSRYKLNVLHWHLTDDQGWRIQIQKYPRLTEVGAWRTEADGHRSGGFYTQQQIREVVRYARRRNIMVVPEIEMPGHASAAVAAYPWLSCPQRPVAVPASWGVFDDILCVGDERTFAFLHDVLDEVAALFPAPYIHIGGDEVPERQWLDSEATRRLMRERHLPDGQAVQGWFIGRLRRDLAARGKTLIGWDEILEGGADAKAVVETWRGPDQARKALAGGNRLIVAGPYYLDTPVDQLTLEDLYRTDAFADPAFAAHPGQVLGAEAPLWSERITTRNAEAMLYPRAIAFAERLWNPRARDYADFQRRLHAQYPWLDAHRVAYGPEDRDLVDYRLSFNLAHRRWRLRAARGFEDLRLHYSLDGSEPSVRSPSFGDVLDRYAPGTIQVVPFRHGVPYLASQAFRIVDNLALGKPVTYRTAPDPRYAGSPAQLVDGITGGEDFHDGQWAGWKGSDMQATIDLQQAMPLHSIQVRFLQQSGSWILLPRRVDFAVSDDGKAWRTLQSTPLAVDPGNLRAMVRTVRFETAAPASARYLRVSACNYGMLPPGHGGAGQPAYVFADEILVH